MSRCVLVVSPPRSGSSCVAGVLRKMGVFMGDRFLQPDGLNEKGYFEDYRWNSTIRNLVGHPYDMPEIVNELPGEYEMFWRFLIQNRNERFDIWGVKTPVMALVLGPMMRLLREEGTDVMIVRVDRDMDEMADSLQRHSQLAYDGALAMGADRAREIQEHWRSVISRQLNSGVAGDAPVLPVYYDELLRDPLPVVAGLGLFVSIGLPFDPDVGAALGFIDRGLRHFGGGDGE